MLRSRSLRYWGRLARRSLHLLAHRGGDEHAPRPTSRAEGGHQREGEPQRRAASPAGAPELGDGIEVDRQDDGQEDDQQDIDGADDQGDQRRRRAEPARAGTLAADPTAPPPSAGRALVPLFDQLGVVDVAAGGAGAELRGPAPPPGAGSRPIRCLSSSSCWSELPLYSSASNCRARWSPENSSLISAAASALRSCGLDLLGHPLERLEGALVGHPGHRLLDPLLGLRPLGPRHQDVLLPLGLFDLVVELAQRELELPRSRPCA